MNIVVDIRSVFNRGGVRLKSTIACAFLFSFISYPAIAQNAAIVGAESFANECAKASTIASTTGSANRQDLESCDRAILDGKLRLKDLVASHVNRGVIHMAMGNPKLALSDINRALSLDSDTGEAYVNRGNLWFFAKQLNNAIADYDKAIELGIEKPHIAHLNRAMAHEQLGDLSKAKLDYQRALSYQNQWPQAQTRLDRVNIKLRNE